MALAINVKDLIEQRKVESNRIEYKASWNPNSIIRTICAFANDIDNTGGGYIVVGIEDEDGLPKLPVKGIEENTIDKILKELVQYCNLIEPRYLPNYELEDYDGKRLLIIYAYAGFGRPYKVNKDVFTTSNKYYYIRKFNSTLMATSEDEKELFYISSDIPFDDRPNLAANIEDLDFNLLRKHLYESNSKLYDISSNMKLIDLAESMNLIAGPPEDLHPRNVGVLMFNPHPEKFIPYTQIDVVDIPDPTGNGMTEKTFIGPIQNQLVDALNYIYNSVIEEKVFKFEDVAEAKRIFNYPFSAIEELLTNAVYHKSYTIREPITVRINLNSIEIISFPGFDRSISEKDIEALNIRSRIYRNRRIGDFLKELSLTERRNTGYPNVVSSLIANESPMPIIDMDENRLYLSVTLPVNPLFKKDESDVLRKRYVYFDENIMRQNIIDLLKTNEEMSISEISRELGYKRVPISLTHLINQMCEKQVLEKGKLAGRSSKVRLKK